MELGKVLNQKLDQWNIETEIRDCEAKEWKEKLWPGDCILSSSATVISKTIRFFGNKKHGKARVSHASVYTRDGLVVESLVKVRVRPIEKYHKQNLIIWRIPDSMIGGKNPMDVRLNVAKAILLTAGDSYGWLKIPLFALDSIFDTYFFTSRIGISNFKVCSNLWAWGWEKVGKINFGFPWRSASPDRLDDWFLDNVKTPIFRNLP